MVEKACCGGGDGLSGGREGVGWIGAGGGWGWLVGDDDDDDDVLLLVVVIDLVMGGNWAV